MAADLGVLIVDHGSSTCKVGFSGDHRPRALVSTVTGTPRDSAKQELYVGDESLELQDELNLTYPIQRGVIKDWDKMELLWSHIFGIVSPYSIEEVPVFLTDSPINTVANREKMTEIMFEKFKVPYLYISNKAALSMFACGKTTGLCVGSGDGLTYVSPIDEGYLGPSWTQSANVGGQDITQSFVKVLKEKDIHLSSNQEFKLARKLKENYGYAATDIEQESQSFDSSKDKTVEVSGKTIKIGKERYQCCESYFQEAKLGKLIVDAIKQLEPNVQKFMCNNVILSGGCTLLEGFEDRLRTEMKKMYRDAKLKITTVPDREFCSFLGSSIVSTLPNFEEIRLSRSMYQEEGVSTVTQKFF